MAAPEHHLQEPSRLQALQLATDTKHTEYLDLVRRDVAVEIAVGVLPQLRGRKRARIAPALAAQRRRDGCAAPPDRQL